MAEQARVKIACPECGAPLPPEAVARAVVCLQCHHTSAPATPPVVAQGASATSTASCPRCHGGLFATTVHEVTLQGCGHCGGIFLDNDGSTYVTRRVDPEIALLADRAAMNGAGRPLDLAATLLACPACATPMSRVRAAGIDLDVCAAHGTWFDRGELHRVIDAYAQTRVRYVAPPSASQTSASQAEAQMAQLREEAWERNARDEAQSGSILAGVSMGVLGLLGALASGSRS